jgi:23S rRNA pseudouridine1911/1915/1917 synthase
LAKNQRSFKNLGDQFRRRQITKKYLALVWGEIDSSGSISYRLAHDPSNKRRMLVIKGSQPVQYRLKSWRALTYFRKIASSGETSFLEIAMRTGVTHQIRAHLAAIGHAIVGDVLYGSDLERSELGRHFLHASYLEFTQPASGKLLGIDSPLPAELRRFMQRRNLADLGG